MKYFTDREDAINFVRETWGVAPTEEDKNVFMVDLYCSVDSNLAPLMEEIREILEGRNDVQRWTKTNTLENHELTFTDDSKVFIKALSTGDSAEILNYRDVPIIYDTYNESFMYEDGEEIEFQ